MGTLPKPQFTLWQAIAAFGELCLRNSERIDKLLREPGPPGDQGPPGQPGKDGYDSSSMSWSTENGGRTLIVTMTHKDQPPRRQEIKTQMLIYQGLWKDGMAADAGDVVTFDGSMWVAMIDTKDRPGTGSKDWRMSVKSGKRA